MVHICMKALAVTALVFAESSALTLGSVKKSIKSLDASNFEATLKEIEPFLTKDAGSSVYMKSIRRINTAAGMLGVEVPKDYAKEAKATQKKREKQDAFIQQKEAERLEAEAAAAEAEAPAEEVAEPEPEPVEA